MTLIRAAEINHLYLWVTITRNGEKESKKMKPAELKKSIKRHQAFYGCTQVSNTYDEYEQTIRFTKGIEFHMILY